MIRCTVPVRDDDSIKTTDPINVTNILPKTPENSMEYLALISGSGIFTSRNAQQLNRFEEISYGNQLADLWWNY